MKLEIVEYGWNRFEPLIHPKSKNAFSPRMGKTRQNTFPVEPPPPACLRSAAINAPSLDRG